MVGNTNPALFGSVSVSGGVLTLAPAANASGSATLTVRATDSGGLWVESDLAVTVNAGQRRPDVRRACRRCRSTRTPPRLASPCPATSRTSKTGRPG